MILERLRKEDAGLSLTELAVYVAVLGVLSTVMATMLLSLFRSEQTVSQVTGTSNSAQIAFRAITGDIERARQFDTTPDSVTASVATGSDGWQCVRWSIAGKKLWLETKADSAGSAWSDPAEVVDGIGPVEAYPFFIGSGATGTGTLEYSFSVAEQGAVPLDVTGQISTRMFAESSCLG